MPGEFTPGIAGIVQDIDRLTLSEAIQMEEKSAKIGIRNVVTRSIFFILSLLQQKTLKASSRVSSFGSPSVLNRTGSFAPYDYS